MFRQIVAVTCLLYGICAGVEIYFTGRTGGQCLKTAFILCDDYTQLAVDFFFFALRSKTRSDCLSCYKDNQATLSPAPLPDQQINPLFC